MYMSKYRVITPNLELSSTHRVMSPTAVLSLHKYSQLAWVIRMYRK